jgi:hypothetical protein
VGLNGTALSWDGSHWANMYVQPSNPDLFAVTLGLNDRVWAAGQLGASHNGALLMFDPIIPLIFPVYLPVLKK